MGPVSSLAASSLPKEIDLGSLNGTDGFKLNGVDEGDRAGWAVGRVGDVNGEGIEDILIGALDADPHGTSGAGEAYVVFGSFDGFPSEFELADLDGENGFVLKGIQVDDHLGNSLNGAGDLNGDGYDDIVVGAFAADPDGRDHAGEAYVVFGRATYPAELEVAALDGSDGFGMKGIHLDGDLGASVANAGDVNRDGIDDLLIGANHASPEGKTESGESYLIFGSRRPFPALLDLTTLDGRNGFAMRGANILDHSGYSVSSAGDFNDDGYDDMLIGAFAANPGGRILAGETYLVFGARKPFPAVIDLGTLDGRNGFVLRGASPFSASGGSISEAGDVNHDGVDDIIVGAPFANAFSGEAYVVYGKRDRARRFPAAIELSSLDGTDGFVLKGVNAGELTGFVNEAGDINADGVDDMLIGVAGSQPHGRAYAVYGKRGRGGRPGSFPAVLDLANFGPSDGLVLTGIATGDTPSAVEFGLFVSATGDVNDDGIDDMLVGAKAAGPGGAGEAYVVYGRCH